jgi:hypothetical protein
MRPLGAAGEAVRFGDMYEQPKIREIEMHAVYFFSCWGDRAEETL